MEYPTYNKRKVNWTGHNMRGKRLLEHVTEGTTDGRIEVTEGRGK